MPLLLDPQAWLSFLTLVVLEIILGIDNLIFLAILVDRLPRERRRSGRILGLGFAMLTRIGLLFSVTWLATLRAALFAVLGRPISGRDLVLFGGGLFLAVKSVLEIRDTLRDAQRHGAAPRVPGLFDRFWLVILQISLLDIVFSLDSVFTAVGLANHVEIMVAAIVASVVFMMVVSKSVSDFIDAHPTIKVLALVFLVLVGGELIAQALGLEIPKGYLYFAMAVSAVIEAINLRLRSRAA